MRFPMAAIMFLVISFIFFVSWLVSSYLVSTVTSSMAPYSSMLAPEGQTSYNGLLAMLPVAFGVICAIFFVMGILLIFVLESWSDEPEYYYRN